MFKLVQATFRREITVKVPVDGGFEKQTMQVTYNALPISETEDLVNSEQADIKTYVRKMVNRIDDVTDADNKPLEWNDGLRDQLLDVPFVFTAVLDGYKEAMSEARVKN